MQDTIDDIKGLMENAKGDLSPASFVQLSSVVVESIRKMQEEAQSKVDGEEVCASANNRLGSNDLMTNAFDMGGSLGGLEEMLTASKGF